MKVLANKEVRVAAVIGMAAMSVIGCKKSDPPPVTQPAAVATKPVDKPAPAVLEIGGEPTEFAVTHLDVTRDQASLHLQLYGSDGATPPGSSFFFNLTLDGDDPESIPGQTWRMTPAAGTEVDADDTVGIFFNGSAIRLEPKSLEVTFTGEYPNLSVTVNGVFLRDGDENKEAKAIGTFVVHAKEKRAN